MADIRREADASGILMVEAFFDRMTERLTEAGELEVADRAYLPERRRRPETPDRRLCR